MTIDRLDPEDITGDLTERRYGGSVAIRLTIRICGLVIAGRDLKEGAIFGAISAGPGLNPGRVNLAFAESVKLVRVFWHPSTIVVISVSIMVFVTIMYLRSLLTPAGHSGSSAILIIGLVGGIVASLGGLIGYVLGTRANKEVRTERIYARPLAFTKRWIGPSLFTFALISGPFMMASLWAGTVNYPVWRFLLFVTAGKVIKLTGLAYVGYHSSPWLLQPLG